MSVIGDPAQKATVTISGLGGLLLSQGFCRVGVFSF
jgi:hypothetical protein